MKFRILETVPKVFIAQRQKKTFFGNIKWENCLWDYVKDGRISRSFHTVFECEKALKEYVKLKNFRYRVVKEIEG